MIQDPTSPCCRWATLAFMLATSLLPVACGPSADRHAASEAKVLNLFIWEEYLDPAVKDDFQKETGIRVVESNFGSNEDMLAKLQAGGGFDLVVPSDYMVQVMKRMKLLQLLDRSKLTYLIHLDPYFDTFTYDPGFAYCVPFQWSTTGIGYNSKQFSTPPDSWAYLFDPGKAAAHKGRMSMLNDPREVIGAALMYLGYSLNSTQPDELKKAETLIRSQKSLVAKYDSESFEDSLASGETVLAHGWSGEFAVAASENPDIQFVLPKEGAVIFVDNLAIPIGAKNVEGAHLFINFLLRPDIAARVANYSLYGSTNKAALPLIEPSVKNGPGFLRPEGVKLYEIKDLGEKTALYDQIWTRLKAE
jgi:spermidine/putrescine transport system substrate-binding protein